MRQIALLILFVFSLSLAFAQKGSLSDAESYKANLMKLDKAKEAIEQALKNDETKDLNKTWYIAGEIYKNIGTLTDADVKTLKISYDPKKLEPNALSLALSSYLKAIELGKLQKKDKFKKDIVNESLPQLRTGFLNYAGANYESKDYDKSFLGFKDALRIDSIIFDLKDKKPTEKFAVDTANYWNAGIIANLAAQYKESIKYFKATIANKYKVSDSYVYIANDQKALKDTTGALQTLKEGLSKDPNSLQMINDLINIYLVQKNSPEAIKLLDIAIAKDPKNQTYHLAKGAMYEKLKDEDNAVACYKKAIDAKADCFDAYYNLGIIYYNRGVKVYDEASNIPLKDKDKFDQTVEKAKAKMKDAMPFFEKANSIDPTEKTTLSALKVIYSKLGDKAKEDAIQAKLDALKK